MHAVSVYCVFICLALNGTTMLFFDDFRYHFTIVNLIFEHLCISYMFDEVNDYIIRYGKSH